MIYAIDISTKEEILLFDGCKHGYNALFCNTFTPDQINNRPFTTFYTDQDGNDVFELTISTYNQFDYDDEFGDDVDENGFIEMINGTKITFEEAKQNGYDVLHIIATNSQGKAIEIISEECA